MGKRKHTIGSLGRTARFEDGGGHHVIDSRNFKPRKGMLASF